jgi:TPR repeat protein
MTIFIEFGMKATANERIFVESLIDAPPFDDGIISLSNAHGFNYTTNIPRDQIAHIYNNAMQGSSESGFIVGMFYLYGFMGTVDGHSDMENAIKWFSKSAADGFVDSQVALGILLYHSEQKSSISWIFQAAMSGNHPRAHYLLARFLCEGGSLNDIGIEGIAGESKYQRAVSHLRKASIIPEALHLLALLFEYNLAGEEKGGNDVNDHFKEALKLYKLAVGKGSVESLYNLALMYIYGRGTQIDYSIATTFLLQAATKNHVPSFRFLGLLAMQDADQPNPRDAIFWLGKCLTFAVSSDLKNICSDELEQVQGIVDVVNGNHRDVLNEYKGQNKMK